MITCIIKGNVFAAEMALHARDIKAYVILHPNNPKYNETRIDVPGQYRLNVVKWMCEPHEWGTPFADGTLLWYKDMPTQ